MRHRVAVLLIALGALAPGCGGDEEAGFGPPPEAPTETAALPNPAPRAGVATPFTAAAGKAQRLAIGVRDSGPGRFRYSAPATVRAGLVEIRFDNDGDVPHLAHLWRVAGTHTVKQALRVSYPQPDWLQRAGGVGLVQPGAQGRTLQFLRPGRYYVAATLGHPGTVATFQVTGKQTGGQLAPAPARVDALDFRFEVSGLRPGRNAVEFHNTGREQHHAFFVPMTEGANLADVRRFFTESSSVGTPPVDPERTRETVVLEGGERQITEIDLDPARYAVICIVRGRQGGPPHVELGMVNEVTVK